MEKKTAEKILAEQANVSEYEIKENMCVVYPPKALLAMQACAAQETKPLQERIKELENALRIASTYVPPRSYSIVNLINKALNP